MKTTHLITLTVLSLALLACGGSNNEETAAVPTPAAPAIETTDVFKQDLSGILEGYFEVKDALVQTNPTDAATHAGSLMEMVEAYIPENLSEEAALLWTTEKEQILASSALLAAETDVEEQRIHFETLSNSFIALIESFGPLENAVYRQTCPMVRGGSADWLSASDQVFNPYHGSRMLRCGSVVSRL